VLESSLRAETLAIQVGLGGEGLPGSQECSEQHEACFYLYGSRLRIPDPKYPGSSQFLAR
jgi:hypothetical protein